MTPGIRLAAQRRDAPYLRRRYRGRAPDWSPFSCGSHSYIDPVAALVIVSLQVPVEHRLHFLDGVKLGAPALDPEVPAQQRAVQPLDDPVRLLGLHLPGCGGGRCSRLGRKGFEIVAATFIRTTENGSS